MHTPKEHTERYSQTCYWWVHTWMAAWIQGVGQDGQRLLRFIQYSYNYRLHCLLCCRGPALLETTLEQVALDRTGFVRINYSSTAAAKICKHPNKRHWFQNRWIDVSFCEDTVGPPFQYFVLRDSKDQVLKEKSCTCNLPCMKNKCCSK